MKKTLFQFFFLAPFFCMAQNPTNKDSLTTFQHPDYTKRKWIVGSVTAAATAGSFIFLNQVWYKDYPRTKFHTFNDDGEWLQMDKVGHAWTSYNINHIATRSWQWAGVNHKNALWLGAGTSLLYMLSIEFLDGHSAEWGWSWGDVTADVLGSALFVSQELAWKNQRIQLKFSPGYHKYHDPQLEQRARELFGKSLPERILKDYNAQHYYLSFNLKSFLPNSNLPPWLNVAIGYGAEGMFGGYQNIAYDANGNIIFDRRDIKRYRQWYLLPDVDLSKIKTKSKLLKTVFEVFYFVLPFPSVEFSNGRFKFNAFTND
jgi:uncharacterized protein YfiM (DUF2279 family)